LKAVAVKLVSTNQPSIPVTDSCRVWFGGVGYVYQK